MATATRQAMAMAMGNDERKRRQEIHGTERDGMLSAWFAAGCCMGKQWEEHRGGGKIAWGRRFWGGYTKASQ